MCFTMGHVNRTEVNVLMLAAVAESPKNESRYAEDDQKDADDGRCSQTFAPLLPALRCTTERQRREAQTYLRRVDRSGTGWIGPKHVRFCSNLPHTLKGIWLRFSGLPYTLAVFNQDINQAGPATPHPATASPGSQSAWLVGGCRSQAEPGPRSRSAPGIRSRWLFHTGAAASLPDGSL